jgi:hypothetical protein
MAIGLDSIGYESYFHRLFNQLGMLLLPTTTNHHRDLDKTCICSQEWQRKPEFKKEEAARTLRR